MLLLVHHLCHLSNNLCIKDTNSNCSQYYRGWVYLFVQCIMQLIEESVQHGFCVLWTLQCVYCKAFEDNPGTLELTSHPKIRSCTKHITLLHHYFKDHLCQWNINIFPIDTNDQPADIATKAVSQDSFTCHLMMICGGCSTCWEVVLECCAALYSNTFKIFSFSISGRHRMAFSCRNNLDSQGTSRSSSS